MKKACEQCGKEFEYLNLTIDGDICNNCVSDIGLVKTIKVEVKKKPLSYHVVLNGISVTTFKEKHEAEEFVGGLKNLNPYHKIKRII
jgi:hypothetical protein